jgi:gamma-glutamyl-gamma-aminobutyrate hydrolase PuuD
VTPLIGITAYGEEAAYGVWKHQAVLLPRTYPDAVFAAGGLPVLLAPRAESADASDRLDGVVLAGGPDVDPARYGAEPDPHTGLPRTERDAAELAVLRRALELGRPVLAVCRGLQVLNVALGGTPRAAPPGLGRAHRHNPRPGVFGRTDIALDGGSHVAAALEPRWSPSATTTRRSRGSPTALTVTGRAPRRHDRGRGAGRAPLRRRGAVAPRAGRPPDLRRAGRGGKGEQA